MSNENCVSGLSLTMWKHFRNVIFFLFVRHYIQLLFVGVKVLIFTKGCKRYLNK